MFNRTKFYSIEEIAQWQLRSENSDVELPSLQRGFVWKANQIESLWDSLLRGFPIGAFLFSEKEDKSFFLLDGQQRATSIAIGHYNPWFSEDNNFWSLKTIPTTWIDIAPREKTNTQKFVIRVVTQSHPWGYQRRNNESVLSVSDRKKALENFKKIKGNNGKGYIEFDHRTIYPYDADCPVPLSFLIESISKYETNWKRELIKMCKQKLPIEHIKPKYGLDDYNYIDFLDRTINSKEFGNDIFEAVLKLKQIQIPQTIIKSEILKSEEEDQVGDDATLFVRLNSAGTRIGGEELIYSIYKASFPKAKQLVENLGATFIAPSLVISLASRLIRSELENGNYPYSLNVNDFRKHIQKADFKKRLKEFIGNDDVSEAKQIFDNAIKVLRSKDDFNIPPVLVKNIIKTSPEIFLMLLQWIKLNNHELGKEERKRILGAITTLAWWGADNNKFVRNVWPDISKNNFWSKEYLSTPFYLGNNFIVHPLIDPKLLCEYLLVDVVKNRIGWNDLYPHDESEIVRLYKNHITSLPDGQDGKEIIKSIWDNFLNKMFGNKSLILFAQRKYINDCFQEFNQMETLDDTNTPWDWDHIYPDSWVYNKRYIDPNTKRWNNSIGNFRALSLEENRSENDTLSPAKRLENETVMTKSFIKKDDYSNYWSKIQNRINEGNNEQIETHLKAVIYRFCNIYEEWYTNFEAFQLFN